jgi:DinB superfamily
MTDPRYPIGEFWFDGTLTAAQKVKHLDDVEQAPARLRAAVRGLSKAHLDTPYREGGWTVRQVVHHLPESHMNSYIRFQLALTEEAPTIRPYLEDRWAKLPDATTAPVELSLVLLESLHKRWMLVLARYEARGMEAHLPPPGNRPDDPGEGPGPVLLARAAPCGTRYLPAGKDGVVGKAVSSSGFLSFRVRLPVSCFLQTEIGIHLKPET